MNRHSMPAGRRSTGFVSAALLALTLVPTYGVRGAGEQHLAWLATQSAQAGEGGGEAAEHRRDHDRGGDQDAAGLESAPHGLGQSHMGAPGCQQSCPHQVLSRCSVVKGPDGGVLRSALSTRSPRGGSRQGPPGEEQGECRFDVAVLGRNC